MTRTVRRPASQARQEILDVAIELLAAQGHDGLQLREVAQRAHVSLSRIYGLFGSRGDLIVAATLQWMDQHAYRELMPPPEVDVYHRLLHVLRAVFEPWEQEPRMLEVFHRARISASGQALVEQGTAAIRPAIHAALAGADPTYVHDVELLLANLFYAVFGRIADGELTIVDVLPSLERAVFRLTADNTEHSSSHRPGPSLPGRI